MIARILVILFLAMMVLGCGSAYRLPRDHSPNGHMWRDHSWPFFRGDASARGAVEGTRFDGSLDVIWEAKSNDKPAGPLSIAHGCLVYSGAKKKIKFFDLATGDGKGRLKAPGAPQTGLVVNDSLAYFGISPYKTGFRCINLITGETAWQKRIKDIASGPIILNDRVLMASVAGWLYAADLETGQTLWEYRTADERTSAGRIASGPTAFAGMVLQPTDDGAVHCLSADSGMLIRRIEVVGATVSAVCVGDLGYIGDVEGRVSAFDPAIGKIVWTSLLDGPIRSSPALAAGRLFVGTSAGKLVAIDAATGVLLWSYETGAVIKASPIVVGDYVIVGDLSGSLFSLDAVTGKLVERRQVIGAIAVSPVTDGSCVYVATEKGRIVCYGEQNEQEESTQ